ncbi:MAG: TldD/PmbA family protein, partial [Synergistaceae bacterium]|nr:TldD/PmbA family protein [Synergistaceae bacterium]
MGKLSDRAEIASAAEFLLSRAQKRPELLGADVLYVFTKSYSLSLIDGVPEVLTSGVSGGISLRCVARDGRQGIATGNDFSLPALADLFDWSCANCLASEKDESVSLFAGPICNDDESLGLFDRELEGMGPDYGMDVCVRMYEIARERDPKVLSVRSSSWSHGIGESYYASTEGVSAWKSGTTASCGVSVVLRDGDAFEMSGYGKSERFASALDPDGTARLAVDKTLRVLGGRPLPTGKYSLLLEPEVSASIVDEIGGMFCSSEVHKGRSLMEGRIGQTVAGPITLVD